MKKKIRHPSPWVSKSKAVKLRKIAKQLLKRVHVSATSKKIQPEEERVKRKKKEKTNVLRPRKMQKEQNL